MYIKPKKSLGQNFLIDKNIQKKIIASCSFTPQDIVLEIGSGKGELTALLAPRVKQIYALEIDPRLDLLLGQALSSYTNTRLIKADILKFNLVDFLKAEGVNQKIKIIGNIPYYISTPIIERLIRYRQTISTAFITVQKEFGRRMRASAGSKEYSSFSCFVQYYAETEILFEIKRNSFKPVPNVDSCFVCLNFRLQPPVMVKDDATFFRLIRTAFNQRRKTLRNSLSGLTSQIKLKNFLEASGIDLNVRPEELTLLQFASLENYLNSPFKKLD